MIPNKGMELNITSREAIRPSSSSPPSPNQNHSTDPFKISLLDQITPATYGPAVFFYPLKPDHDHETPQTLCSRLKTSLSETLTLFYPYSGRVTDNLHVGNFDAGVPFLEALATCQMSRFLRNPDLSSLTHLLPCHPFRDETSNPNMPLFSAQLTVFACGGVALGVCMSHKITDASTCAAFLNSWAAATARDPAASPHVTQTHVPDFSEASSRFPGMDPLPRSYTSVYENVWFGQSASYKTERFVFGAESLTLLKDRARSEVVPKPSRVQALSGFIWKSAMEASRKASLQNGVALSPKSRIMAQAVNIRRRREEQEPRTTSIGNLFWWAIAIHYDECAAKDGDELVSLMELVNDSISEVNSDYMRELEGEEALELVREHLKQIDEIYSNEDPEIYGFTSWVNMGFKDLDFGLGKPVWVGAFGEVGASFRNLSVFTDAADTGGIEAWVILEEKVLDNLKNDAEFLALASVNPPIHIS